MATTLTRESLLGKCERRIDRVEVDGFGEVLIRSPDELTRSRRVSGLFDENGSQNQRNLSLRRVHDIIDHVMADESTPMFTERDCDAIASLDSYKLDALVMAIQAFKDVDEKKEQVESSDTSES